MSERLTREEWRAAKDHNDDARPKCRTCPHYFPRLGSCTRFPPSLNARFESHLGRAKITQPETGWPFVEYEEFCGEHPEYATWHADWVRLRCAQARLQEVPDEWWGFGEAD